MLALNASLFRATKVRPSCSLTSGDSLFSRSTQSPLFLWRSSGLSPSAEDYTQLFIQMFDLLFDRGGPFELLDGEVVYIHAASKYSKPMEIKR